MARCLEDANHVPRTRLELLLELMNVPRRNPIKENGWSDGWVKSQGMSGRV
jgi:hypothetical protein